MKKICIGFLLAVLLVLMGCQNANTPEDKPSEVKFSGLTANGTAGSVSTTKLTLTFSADPTTLATSDITVTGATKGALTGTGITRTLSVSGITVANSATVTVALSNPAGFTITPASKTVAVNVAASSTSVTFTSLTANGTAGLSTTSELTLTFSADPTTLAASDITVTGATKGALTGTGTTRILSVSEITVANGANITVVLSNPAGFTITPASKTVAVNVAPPVAFSGLTANGTAGSVSTTKLTLTFSADPTTLAASYITVTGATKGALTGTGTTRTLAVSVITVADGATVTVALSNPAGFTFTPASKTVAVNVNTSKTYSIGDTGPSGVGKVFYVTNEGLSGLEAAPNTWNGGTSDPILQWKIEKTSTSGTEIGTEIGTGAANTATMTGTPEAKGLHPAATACAEYSGGGKNDWFLPSINELNEMYLQKDVIGGFDAYYWSSSQYDGRAGAQYFRNGYQFSAYEDAYEYVRPVRAF